MDTCRRRIRRGALIAAVGVTVAGCSGWGGQGQLTGKSIRYQVEHYGSPEDSLAHQALTIGYSTKQGWQEQAGVGLPWTKVVGTAGDGFRASVRAQFDGYGTIACRIVADGKVVEQNVSELQPYPTVECSA